MSAGQVASQQTEKNDPLSLLQFGFSDTTTCITGQFSSVTRETKPETP
jgi:hypothetical protein